MIPSTTNRLLVAEDWTKIYQSYRNADFKSYDFETLRRTMITYLRENYPEDFNDYIDSSEYMALVDLIAYLGQNLSFRIDLNSRENFLETASRRDSILRLANLISYNPKRNQPANGFLKIVSISTTDNVIDNNGISLTGRTVAWNDPTNTNWYQQFITVMNSAMGSNFVFGHPYDSAVIDGIQTEQYRINSSNTNLPIYSFTSNISGTQMGFEVVSSMFANKNYVYEETPTPGSQFSLIYKNDSQGNGSSNSGFFVHFRQGALNSTNFSISNPVPNYIVGVNASNINNSDTWLWQLDNQANYNTAWTQVNNLVGNNIIYNSISNDIKNLYSVTTRANDQVDLNFADGNFGNLPKGNFAFYYRQSNGLNYVIKPEQLTNINLTIPYRNKNGQSATLSLVCSLQTTVSNSAATESNATIKTNAPQSYYVQNRMITGEDYNIAPLTAGTDILKIKSVNRLSSGISKYFELSDITGQYSATNIFADDGILYKQILENNFEFSFVNSNEIVGAVLNQLNPILTSTPMRNFYLDQYPRVNTGNSMFAWVAAVQTVNQTNGYFSLDNTPTAVGGYTDNNLKYLTPGTLVKFVPPAGQYFLPNNNLTSVADNTTKKYIWSKVVSVIGDGFNSGAGSLANGTGPITLSGNIPSTAIIDEIIPTFNTTLSAGLQQTIVDICLTTRNFGLSFDEGSRSWYVITDNNLDLQTPFNLFFQKDTQNINKDNSWLVAFEWTGLNYKVRYRICNYIFESNEQTAFYVDNTSKNYDFVTNAVIKDRVNVLANNNNAVGHTVVTATGVVSTTTTVPFAFTYSSSTFQVVNTSVSVTTVANQKTELFTATSVAVIPNIATFTVASTAGIQAGPVSIMTFTGVLPNANYIAFHPSFPYGYAQVFSVSTTTVRFSSAMNSSVAQSSYVLFLPNNVTTTAYATTQTVITTTTSKTAYTHVTTPFNQNFTTSTSVTTYANTYNAFTFTTEDTNQTFSLAKDYAWQIDSAVIEPDGYINPTKVNVSFFDADDNGQIDDPDAFIKIVLPETTSTQTTFNDKFVFFKYLPDGVNYKLTNDSILSYPTADQVTNPADGQLYYFYSPDVNSVQLYSADMMQYELRPEYFAYYGRKGLKFQYEHNSGQERRIDPSKTNLIDIYMLTQSYDTAYRNWLATRSGTQPVPPTSSYLEESFSPVLLPIKSISDELVFQPTRYKIIFGELADSALRGTFKAVRSKSSTASDNDLKTRILLAIETFFSIDYWEFGQSFYFSELSTYVMNQLSPDITNFVVVPNVQGSFGSLFEVSCQSNEIFINGATVNDIEIIDALTASQIKASGTIITSSTGQ